MTPSKAREILWLNIKEAETSMPLDVATALTMGAGAIARIEAWRAGRVTNPDLLLPGETLE